MNILICDGIVSGTRATMAFVTSRSKIKVYNAELLGDSPPMFSETQTLDLKNSLALDLAFHQLNSGEIILGVGKDSGAVVLYKQQTDDDQLEDVFTLRKHEDWVRCIAFYTLENGETLLATGGQDYFIALWRFVDSKHTDAGHAGVQSFEFQSYQLGFCTLVFDSMIIGHEGWITSLDFNEGKLLSCSSDQSIIVWTNQCDIWTEEARLGSVGGEIPGGFGAKFDNSRIISWGFHGAIQIWNRDDGDWSLEPSVTGHFNSVTDLDYHPEGHFVVTTSRDQTTRIFAPWGLNRWHEISRPQIHGHDLFAVGCCGDFIVSGAEEKILRAFQPTQVFISSLEEISDIVYDFKNVAECATLPPLGLSNQSARTSRPTFDSAEQHLDEDFLRSQTLWPEVAKLYGHVYEIACIATSTKLSLVASASQSSKPQFSAIILWNAKTWEKIEEFPHHKLNVTDLEFTKSGTKLLSVSRDRTWAVWSVYWSDEKTCTMKLVNSGALHTRALWVGTWSPEGNYFVTGARDKKLCLWKSPDTLHEKYEVTAVHAFEASVSAAAINEDNFIAVGLESGFIFVFEYKEDELEDKRLMILIKIDNSVAHHGTVERLRFNPREKCQLASAGADRLVKIYQLMPR